MPDRQSLAFIDTSAVGGGGGGRGLGGKALPPRRNLGGARGAAGRSPGDGPDEGDELEELVMLENALDGNGGRSAWDEGVSQIRGAPTGALSAAQTALEALGSEIGDDADDVAAASSRAATRVQAVHRGKSTRNSLGMAPGAAEVRPEAAPAGDLYGNLGDIPSALHSLDLGGDRAATQLQSRHRGNLARQHGATQKRSATQLQSRHRGNLARRGLREPGLAAPATDHETIQAKLEEGLMLTAAEKEWLETNLTPRQIEAEAEKDAAAARLQARTGEVIVEGEKDDAAARLQAKTAGAVVEAEKDDAAARLQAKTGEVLVEGGKTAAAMRLQSRTRALL